MTHLLIFYGTSPEALAAAASQELLQLFHWCTTNRLTNNYNKTNYILFSNKIASSLPALCLNNNKISRVSHILGVTYDESLSFSSHVSNLCFKLSSL